MVDPSREKATAHASILVYAAANVQANAFKTVPQDDVLNKDAWDVWYNARRIDAVLFRVPSPKGEAIRATEMVLMAEWCLTQAAYALNRVGGESARHVMAETDEAIVKAQGICNSLSVLGKEIGL